MGPVLLDAMGTLVALDPPAPALRRALRERHGLEVAPADAERAMRAEIAYYRAHHREGHDPATLDDLRRRCAEVARAELPAAARALGPAEMRDALLGALRFRAYPDAAPALRALRAAGRPRVVVSNWDAGLGGVLEDVGLRELVDGVVVSAQAGCAKPDPAIFRRALREAACGPEGALHVGDSVHEDVQGARAAGLAAVLLARSGDPPAGVPAIRSLAELPAYPPT